jgi:hypothetical protein
MYLEPFYKFFPDVADEETRTLFIDEGPGIPAGEYVFVDAYCTDPDCDCQRVMLNVIERKRGIVATISYGFNPAKIPAYLEEPNPFLDPLNPQSEYAEELLALFQEVVLDDEYEERLKRHYRMVKDAVRSQGASRAKARTPTIRLWTAEGRRRQVERVKRLRKQQKTARRKHRRR